MRHLILIGLALIWVVSAAAFAAAPKQTEDVCWQASTLFAQAEASGQRILTEMVGFGEVQAALARAQDAGFELLPKDLLANTIAVVSTPTHGGIIIILINDECIISTKLFLTEYGAYMAMNAIFPALFATEL